jgi:hypothetical protein
MGTTVSKNDHLRKLRYMKITIYTQAYLYISGKNGSISFLNCDSCCDAIIKINKNIIFYFDEVYNFNFISNDYDFIKPIFLNKIYLSDLEYEKISNNYVLDEKFKNGDLLNYEPLFMNDIYFKCIKSNEMVIDELEMSIQVFSYLKYFGNKLLFISKCYLCFSFVCSFMKIPIFVNNNLMNFGFSYISNNLFWLKKSFNFLKI